MSIWKLLLKLTHVRFIVVNHVVLSGLGFENGGVSGAHALGVGITALPDMEKKFLHGEMVALGILTELTMEKRFEERAELAVFFSKVGLPVCWSQLGIDVKNADQIHKVLNSCFEKFYAIKNMPFEKSIEVYSKGIQEAEDYCQGILKTHGQAMWLKHHASHVFSQQTKNTTINDFPYTSNK